MYQKEFSDVDTPFTLKLGAGIEGQINRRHFRQPLARFFFRWDSIRALIENESFKIIAQAISNLLERTTGNDTLTVKMLLDVGWMCAMPGNKRPDDAQVQQKRRRAGKRETIWSEFVDSTFVAPKTDLLTLRLRISRRSVGGGFRWEVYIIRAYPGPSLPTWTDDCRNVFVPAAEWVFYHPATPGAA